MQISFGNIPVVNNQFIDLYTAKLPFNISLNNDEGLHTIMIYDLSSPDPMNPVNSPLMHFFEVNIPGNRLDLGEILIPYISPSPPSGNHVYVIDLFKQSSQIDPEIPATSEKREIFPVTQFVQTYKLSHINRLIFIVDPPAEILSKHNTDSPDDKYCRCVEHVKARGSAISAYAVCHASIQGESGRPDCS
jgi:hypothetical protein